MAQHSHSVYGNAYPYQNYYQKNRASHHNIGRNSNVASSHHILHHPHNNGVIPKPSELIKKSLFKSTDVLNKSGRAPFSNRNGKLHRSNPHLHFGGLSYFSESQGPSTKPPKTPSKWRTELSNAANFLPRKWCDFVFRRNADNALYRSESFRFIQKTNSLQLLPPLSAGLSKYRNKRLEVPVSEDYVDPLDKLVGCSSSSSSQSCNNKSTSVKADSASTPEIDKEDDAYNEIIENYNAPYYYSDTIKDPTYCSPWNQACGDINNGSDHNCQHPKDPPPTLSQEDCCQHHHQRSGEPETVQNPSITEKPMARKRYETAFLPTSSHHPSSSQSSSPDVDCLILSLESSCSLVESCGKGYYYGESAHNVEGNRVSATGGIQVRVEQDPSILQCQSSTTNNHSIITHTSGSSTTNSSPLSTNKKPNMPLSEPLPQKKYSNNNNNCSSSSSSPSTSTSLTSCRPPDKRLTMMKDNSVSSLESIDSTKSEDLHSYSRSSFGGHRSGQFGRGANCKLLSPISDKSPLEPISLIQSSLDGNESSSYQSSHRHHSHSHHENPWPNHIINTAELTNVPWDMPKIKRRLALLADSGISLDCPGNTQSDIGQFSSHGRRSFDDFQYTTSSHIRENLDLQMTDGSMREKPRQERNKSKAHNLYLNLDNSGGLVQDEYYEDPRFNFTSEQSSQQSSSQQQQTSKPKLPWLTNVTSVQVHVPGASERPPPKPDRCRMKLDFGALGNIPSNRYEIDPSIELEAQEWFHGAITRSEAEAILRTTKEGSFLVRNCESSSFNRYSLSLKSARGFIHIRIEPNSLGTFSLGEQEFPSVPHLVLHFMCHRLPIKGAEHVKLVYPVITQLL